MDRLQFLFYFTSSDFCLMETKTLGLDASASMSEIYKWTLYSKISGEFAPLTFRNMVKEQTCEYRSFVEAELKFDETKAELKLQDHLYHLVKEDPANISEKLKLDLEKFLLNLG
ncbi:MAG: hypothetical protein H0V66_13310 [Bdellovibrionales bacterium]|nr:hypothetical protein [Bdellovibrionales bacterium]